MVMEKNQDQDQDGGPRKVTMLGNDHNMVHCRHPVPLNGPTYVTDPGGDDSPKHPK